MLLDPLGEKFGTVLVIVDQLANIGALRLMAEACDCGCEVAYLPGAGDASRGGVQRIAITAPEPPQPNRASGLTVS
ncbi:hypothetical protein ABH920_003210 [Catenulispora sp. EB89]|uniref:hypothetical protein n=1 Tax=Catenulispora sp. EB89 TaxID=3156257 RepID=UPI003516AA5F